MSRYVIKQGLLEDVKKLLEISESNQTTIVELAIESLEGRDLSKRLSSFARINHLDYKFVENLTDSVSKFVWELTKTASNLSMIIGTLKSVLPNDLAKLLSTCYQQHEMHIKTIRKSALMVSGRRYHDINWRVDVEIASRSMLTTTQTMYMLGVESSNYNSTTTDTMSLQSNFTNLQNFQRELQRAVHELQSIHAQRLTRYIV
jgi:hypothetical protein